MAPSQEIACQTTSSIAGVVELTVFGVLKIRLTCFLNYMPVWDLSNLFSTLYATFPHNLIKQKFAYLKNDPLINRDVNIFV